ncbi:methyltransferase domain-containing protein [Oscillochloris sp. ZM17-4]|uniref:class I SAM-dependent methyltransferase n=1 Tax=Oscillochloris sp. ZM17-4 TaxID=2866714 RepID=UPI001C731A8E|nr:class I SAM-dependent methyltransferase [Oscillochloris sp. ZM17-4]MBX0330810.1 methyltransferase domain-containing protein [Oscillochloris sp. ZM17-4]
MYPEAFDYLTCPRHPEARLALEAGARYAVDGAILRGRVRCPTCGARYRIAAGILDLLGPLALPDSPAQLTNYLPLTAWGYERIWRPRALTLLSGEPLGYDRELPLVAGLLAPGRGGLFVDAACSNGLYARAIERARGGIPGHTIGVDHARPMLRQARAFARAQGLRISYVRAKAQSLPVAAGSAAGVAMGGSLNEIGDADAALRELRRALAPDGRCMMMGLVGARGELGRTLQGALAAGGVGFWPLSELNRRMAAAGLRLRAQWRYGVVVFSLLVV